MFMVTGSQADRAENNKLTLLKVSDIQKTQSKADSDEESDDDDDDSDDNVDADPTLEHVNIPHMGGINRVRSMPQQPGIIATMAETRKTHIFDCSRVLNNMMTTGPRIPPTQPSFTYEGHKDEGAIY